MIFNGLHVFNKRTAAEERSSAAVFCMPGEIFLLEKILLLLS